MKQSKNIVRFFERVVEDDRLYPSHISMYVALFQLWSSNHFQNSFRISREEVMKLSKIKSIATYHKCIKELCDAGFIIYLPSYDSYKGSLIEIINLESRNVEKKQSFSNRRFLLTAENLFSIPARSEVELYFTERNVHCNEADQFYSLYQTLNWKCSNNKPMKCWRAAARNWIYTAKKANNMIIQNKLINQQL